MAGIATLRSLPCDARRADRHARVLDGRIVGTVGRGPGARPRRGGRRRSTERQDIDFALAKAAYQGHFAEHDEFVDDDAVAELQAHLRLLGHEVDFHRYPGTGHWFFEDDRPAAYVERAAELAWERTMAFLHRHLDGG